MAATLERGLENVGATILIAEHDGVDAAGLELGDVGGVATGGVLGDVGAGQPVLDRQIDRRGRALRGSSFDPLSTNLRGNFRHSPESILSRAADCAVSFHKTLKQRYFPCAPQTGSRASGRDRSVTGSLQDLHQKARDFWSKVRCLENP